MSMRARPLGWVILLSLFGLLLEGSAIAAETNSGILFLQMRVKDGVYSVVSATNTPGVLKSRRTTPRPLALQFVLEDDKGAELWTEHLADPCIHRLEFEDPLHPGEMQVKEVRRTEAEFSIRMPCKPGRRSVAVYRRRASNSGPAPAPQEGDSTRELAVRLALPKEAMP